MKKLTITSNNSYLGILDAMYIVDNKTIL